MRSKVDSTKSTLQTFAALELHCSCRPTLFPPLGKCALRMKCHVPPVEYISDFFLYPKINTQYSDIHKDIFVCVLTKKQNKQKQTPWPLVRERTIPTERPPLVDEI
jgi:hypothetical protein